MASDYAHNSVYALQENKFGLGTELEGKELNYFKILNTPNVKEHIRKATEAGQQIVSVSGGVVVGGVGVEVGVGKAKVKVEASLAEIEVSKDKKGLQTELKAGNAAAMFGTENSGVGDEVNVVNIQADSEGENVRFIRAEGKTSFMGAGASSEEGEDFTTELRMQFDVFAGKIKTNIVKAKEYMEESVNAFGAYLTEVFNMATNKNSKQEKKN